jgi:putative spermidine/putrescine transport system permease protein
MNRTGRVLAALLLAAIYGFVVLPLIVVVACSLTSGELMQFPPQGFSLRWFVRFFHDDGFMQALLLSLRIAAVTTVAVTILASLAALGRRALGKRAQRWVQLALTLPLLLPELLTAMALLLFFYPIGLGKTLLGLQIAHIVVTLPFAFIAVTAALDQVDPALEEASASLGAAGWQTFWWVLQPLIRAGMTSGALLAFVTSFDMFTVSFLLKPLGGDTLPLALFDYLSYDFDPTAAAAATVSVILAVLGVIVIERTVGLRTL